MKCFIDTLDKNKGASPEQELTEEQFFEQFAALEEGLALVQICRPLPVYPEYRTSTGRFGWSGWCQQRTIALAA
jgi:hypothetical protein